MKKLRGMHEICWCIHSQFSSWTGQWVALGPRRGLRWAESTLVILGIHKCRVPVGLFASLTSWSSWRAENHGVDKEIQAGVLGGQRGPHQCLRDPQKCKYFHYWMSIHTSQRGGREPGCDITPESTACGCCWRQYPVSGSLSSHVLSVRVPVCVCVWSTSLALLLVKPLNRKAAAMSIIWEGDL